LLLFPKVRVNVLVFLFIFIRVISVPAWMMLLWWIGLQLLAGLPQLSSLRPEVSVGVAVWAHIGGFAAGLVLVKLFVNPRFMVQKLGIGRRSLPRAGW
jgi:membrane associated rhomboid family serine protease